MSNVTVTVQSIYGDKLDLFWKDEVQGEGSFRVKARGCEREKKEWAEGRPQVAALWLPLHSCAVTVGSEALNLTEQE